MNKLIIYNRDNCASICTKEPFYRADDVLNNLQKIKSEIQILANSIESCNRGTEFLSYSSIVDKLRAISLSMDLADDPPNLSDNKQSKSLVFDCPPLCEKCNRIHKLNLPCV